MVKNEAIEENELMVNNEVKSKAIDEVEKEEEEETPL